MRLSDRQKTKIGKYKESNPKVSIAEIADKFKVSYDQAWRAIKQFEKGELGKNIYKGTPKTTLEIIEDFTAEELLQNQFHTALAELHENKNLTITDRIEYLAKLANTKKIFQTLTLQNHLKKIDAEVIFIIIRKFKPEASDDECILIYNEAKEIWAASQH